MTLRGIHCVEFPPQIGPQASSLINNLCNEDPVKRLGSNTGVEEIRHHSWFKKFDWKGLRDGITTSPIKPVVKGPCDASNFDTFSDEESSPPDEMSGWDADF